MNLSKPLVSVLKTACMECPQDLYKAETFQRYICSGLFRSFFRIAGSTGEGFAGHLYSASKHSVLSDTWVHRQIKFVFLAVLLKRVFVWGENGCWFCCGRRFRWWLMIRRGNCLCFWARECRGWSSRGLDGSKGWNRLVCGRRRG